MTARSRSKSGSRSRSRWAAARPPARLVKPPADLVEALKAAPPAWEHWRALSPSHQREHVAAIEEAKKPETRARRIEGAVRMVLAG